MTGQKMSNFYFKQKKKVFFLISVNLLIDLIRTNLNIYLKKNK